MNTPKFTLNSLLLIVIILSAIAFFFTVLLTDLATQPAVNQFNLIEDTSIGVRYSSLYPSGLYTSVTNTDVPDKLMLEGNFGYDWGAAAEGEALYLNEYTTSSIGLMLCQLVRVDLNSFEKEVLLKDTILRGRCASGELVCLSGFLMPSNSPKTNPLCSLYGMSSENIRPEGDSAVVLFIDPETFEILYSVRDDEALTDSFDARYLQRTLEEVRG